MAYCNNCGSEIIGNGAYCTTCGAPVAAAPAQPAYNAAEKAAADAKIEANFGKALAATICSAFPVASIVAIVLGNNALKEWVEAKAMADRGGFRLTGKHVPTRVLALVGKITGIVMTAFWGVYFLILAIVAIAAATL